MKKYKFEIVLFIINAIYMILELIASRILAPYFGSSNLIWTSVIGIILLSTSVGNYIGGIIADKNEERLNSCVNSILLLTGSFIFAIPIIQNPLIKMICQIIHSIKIGAIVSTIMLFFIPSMLIGMLSPIIIRIKMSKLNEVGKTSGSIYALATLGSIFGTFLGGFYLIPSFGSTQILFVLSIITFLMIFFSYDKEKFEKSLMIIVLIAICFNCIGFYQYYKKNNDNGKKVLNGDKECYVNYDTEYGKVTIYNTEYKNEMIRCLNIDRGNESASFIDENKYNELVFEYTKFYDKAFKAGIDINNALMIGGAGYSYPKYFISKYTDKNMDVVEIDPKITDIAKEYFFLDKLIDEFNLEENKRLNIFSEDGRTFLNNNSKKYDVIFNDSFSGNTPAKTLTTKEAIEKIYNSLNKHGLYLTNVISSIDGKNSKFIKAEVNTLKSVFKNVYVLPCKNLDDFSIVQNNMVVATDDDIVFENSVELDLNNAIFLTDNYCPVDTIIPDIDA